MEKTVNKNYVYQGRIIKVRNDDALAENGNPCKREIVEHRGGAAILAVDDKKFVYLVKQYRYAYEKELLEIPAGKIEENENPYDTAIRELEEELGLKADRIEPFGEVYPTPGYCNEIIRLYLAENFVPTHTHFDDDEYLVQIKVTLDEAIKMIMDGTIKDSKTIVALLKYKEMQNK